MLRPKKRKAPTEVEAFPTIALASLSGCLIGLTTRILLVWCRRGDLNPHRDYSPLDPESSASANSATSAFVTGTKIEDWIENIILLYYIF